MRLTKQRRDDIKYRINVKGQSPESVARWYKVTVATVLKVAGRT